jgi:predicted transposase YdaD
MLMTEFNINIAKEVWMEEAEEIGEARGKREGKLEAARAMISDGLPVEAASKYSSIPIDEILRYVAVDGEQGKGAQ